MLGRDGSRNAVSPEKNPPTVWSVEQPDKGRLNRAARGVRWSMPLGSETYSSPVVADDFVWIGTNENNKPSPVSRPNSVLKCFRVTDGVQVYEYNSPWLGTVNYDAGWKPFALSARKPASNTRFTCGPRLYLRVQKRIDFMQLRRLLFACSLVVALSAAANTIANDWPMYGRDDAELALAKIGPPFDSVRENQLDRASPQVGPGDWPQWGGSRQRNNTPTGKNIPTHWDVGDNTWKEENLAKFNHKLGHKPKGSKNIKWAVKLGSEAYGNPVVANGRVFLGTNNGAAYLKRYPASIDLGVLLCFEEETGNFLWQHSNQKLPTGRVNDWPNQGVCSTPVVDGDRLWYVSNRGEVVCLDTEGFYDGENDGSIQQDWVNLFNIDTFVHTQIKNAVGRQSLPNSILSEFASRNIILPKIIQVSVQEYKKSWTIAELELNTRGFSNSRKPLYRILLEEDQLKISPILDGQEGTVLFQINDRLFTNIGTSNLVYEIRKDLEKHGIKLLEDQPPQTLNDGELWAFEGVLRGIKTPLQLRQHREQLSVMCLQVSDLESADVVWSFDMMKELGVHQHNMANCSMLTVDGMLFVCTSNGVDDAHFNVPAPDAPSFVSLGEQAIANPDSADNRIQFVPLDSVWDGELINEIKTGSAIYTTPIVANDVLYIATRNTLYAIEETTAAK